MSWGRHVPSGELPVFRKDGDTLEGRASQDGWVCALASTASGNAGTWKRG